MLRRASKRNVPTGFVTHPQRDHASASFISQKVQSLFFLCLYEGFCFAPVQLGLEQLRVKSVGGHASCEESGGIQPIQAITKSSFPVQFLLDSARYVDSVEEERKFAGEAQVRTHPVAWRPRRLAMHGKTSAPNA